MICVHEHVLAAGAVRNNNVYRYCVVDECDHALSIYGTKTKVQRNDDVARYRSIAEGVIDGSQ